jgi:hypothetical protein
VRAQGKSKDKRTNQLRGAGKVREARKGSCARFLDWTKSFVGVSAGQD